MLHSPAPVAQRVLDRHLHLGQRQALPLGEEHGIVSESSVSTRFFKNRPPADPFDSLRVTAGRNRNSDR